MTATAAFTSAFLAKHSFDCAINAGIFGSFNSEIPLGEVVIVERECISELGVEDGEQFISADKIGLHGISQWPYTDGWILDSNSYFREFQSLRKCSGITVNTVHGNDDSIADIKSRITVDVESMEGAGFLYSCRLIPTPAIQLRAVSNYVERRDKSKWNIPKAIDNLNEILFIGLDKLTKR